MALELRDTGISVVGDVPWGTHFCSFYDTKRDLLDILIPFFKTGLKNNEFCLWIISNSELLTMQEARNALQEVLPDLDQHMGEKSIEFVGHDWFLSGGSFDFRRVANRFKEKGDEALARGYVGMRVNASPAWLETTNPKQLRTFEAQVDQLYRHERIIASCTYPIGSSRADFLLDVARNHQFAIARRHGIWDIVETPELTQAKTEIERLNAELEQRVIERTKKLEATTARLRAEIEERKEAEGAVRQSEERFAAFMDNLPGYSWMKDLQGRYVYVNKMVRGLPGYESLGKTDAQIWPADLAAEYRENDKQVIAAKRPLQTLEHFQQEGKQRYMVGSKFPIFDKTGAVALVGGVGVDITERIEAEEALRESETKLKQAQQLANIGYWERDLVADRITWSKETGRIVGLESFRGVPNQALLRQFIHPDDWQHHQEVLNEALQGSRLFDVEVRVVRPDGNIRFVHIRDEIVRDESGKPIRMFGAVQDVTERRRAEDETRRQNEILQQIFDHIPVMIGFVGRDGRIKLVNREWERTLGWSLEKVLKPDFDTFAELYPDPKVRAETLDFIAKKDGVWADFKTRVRDGRVIDTTWANVHLSDGTAIGIGQDITERKQAEDALRRSEEHLRLVINTIPTMAWTLRPDGVVDFLNQRWLDYAGLSLEQYVKDPTGPIHPDDVPRIMEKWRAQMAIGKGYEDEMRLRRADGEYRWFLVRTEPLHDEQGRIIKWYGVSTDIEDRKRAELEARTLINAIPDQIWSGPPDGTNDYVNDRWRAETGLGLEEMRGDGWKTLLHPDDRERVLKAWQYSVQTGTPYEQEERHRTAGGAYRWYLNRGVPLRDAQGRIIRWYGSNTDIEDRKQAEEKLKHREVQLAQAQRLAHIGSWDWDLRTNAVTWSEELYHIFGLQPGTISVAGEVDRFIHPDDLDLGWDTVKRAVASKEPYDYYHRIVRPDGTERIARSRGSIMSDERGEPIRVFGATQDVTELKHAEEKLKATTEQLRALSASVQSAREEESKRIAREIHDELGGALTSWRWDLEEIRDEMSIPLDASQVATVRNKIEGMIKLTETTLDTVRRLASELRPAALELGLVQGLEWQALQFENRTGIPVQLECVVEKVDLDNGQATAVFRILQEALTNIQRHAQATHVNITCWEESGRFILTIKDNGRGITESEKSDRQSLGLLGMRERAHLTGGEINIESAEGEGTKITVQVPLADSGRLRPVLQSDS